MMLPIIRLYPQSGSDNKERQLLLLTFIEMLQNVFLYLVLKTLDQIVFQNTFGLNDFNLVIFGFEPESSHQGAL